MLADVVFLPRDLEEQDLRGKAIVVFDVLRATTSMAAALAAGVAEIRVFGSTREAAEAAGGFDGARLLCGEEKCLPPAGFDLGNSPNAFKADLHGAKTMFMSTTNGTRAIIAATSAAAVLTGAIVNAAAVGRKLAELGLDITLLCAGTGGHFATEDLMGAGAVLDAVQAIAMVEPNSDRARLALRLFRDSRDRLREMLADSSGGRNVIGVGLDEDIDFAARLNAVPVVGVVKLNPLRVTR